MMSQHRSKNIASSFNTNWYFTDKDKGHTIIPKCTFIDTAYDIVDNDMKRPYRALDTYFMFLSSGDKCGGKCCMYVQIHYILVS